MKPQHRTDTTFRFAYVAAWVVVVFCIQGLAVGWVMEVLWVAKWIIR